MSKLDFKVGEKVEVVRCSMSNHHHIGLVGKITDITSDGSYEVRTDDGTGRFCNTTEVKMVSDNPGPDTEALRVSYNSPISKKAFIPSMTVNVSASDSLYEIATPSPYTHTFSITNTTNPKGGSVMNRLSLIAKKTFDKEVKTLIEAGVLDSDLNVCDSQFVLSFIVNQYKTELAALAQEQLDEAKASKGK